jgi:hypothetical protein
LAIRFGPGLRRDFGLLGLVLAGAREGFALEELGYVFTGTNETA